MAKLDFPNFQKHLSAFDFSKLFTEVLGWNNAPAEGAWQADKAGETDFSRRTVAELGGVVAIQVVVNTQEGGGWPDEAQRMRIWKHIARSHAENLIIFTERQARPLQSQWYWVKRSKDPVTGKPKLTPRRHEYFAGQPVDLFASKLQAMVVELSELDEAGRLPVLEAARRIQAALDVDKTTKKFFTAYQQQHLELLGHIKGIANERDKRWYASVLLNRLMFVWFMQKKFFLDGGNADYLQTKLAASQQSGPNRFFGEFLNALFFEAFAKPEADRSKAARALTGQIPYLNGGLFLHHKLELDANHAPRVGTTLTVADAAFEGIFNLFASFTWHLDDTPGGDSDEINPDVLGYIFEKYINQKAFGAYYTRPEITGYLAERSIHQMILERVHEPAIPELKIKEIKFDTVADLLARMDTQTALKLVKVVLPSITILDPAVGSGAFLVAALKTLINVYYAVVGRAELGASAALQAWLRDIQKDHASVGYYIKRRIVTDNLHGVDIMEEACEIAKLRLFLAMVSSVRKVEDLEPLPNIDFNILPGNSLVGLMRVDEHEFNSKQDDLFKPPFRELLVAKSRKLESYRHAAEVAGKDVNLRTLRDEIDAEMQHASGVMNELLRDQFEALSVKYEEAKWDAKKKDLGKPKKRQVTVADIAGQTPFHWGYVFDDIVQKRGGFDIILTNPPWDVFMPHDKEFLQAHEPSVSINKMPIKEFKKLLETRLLGSKEIQDEYLRYQSAFPHISEFFRSSQQYRHQSALVNGKKTGSHLNLYKLFLERCFNLLRPCGHCGAVIPSGIYSDEGAKGLREMLFENTQIEGMFCFENRKTIFEGVDSRFKFVVLTFEKTATTRIQVAGESNFSAPPDDLLAPQNVGARMEAFPAAFMRLDVAELDKFPSEGSLHLDISLIKKLSPDTFSVMEFKSDADVAIVKKMYAFPVLGGGEKGWSLVLRQGLNMTSDHKLFHSTAQRGYMPLIEGKMAHQFQLGLAPTRSWINPTEGRKALLGRTADTGQSLEYECYRLAFRRIARNTDERTFISTVLPKSAFGAESFNIAQPSDLSVERTLYLVAILNSFAADYLIRMMVTANLSMFFVYQVPVPRIADAETAFHAVKVRAARLVCVLEEYDELAKSLGLKSHRDGATDPTERAKLRAELDGLVAHLYGLTEAEFAHILGTFPLVAEPTKIAALNAWRDVQKGLIS
jgi:hypothetical protein